MGFDNTLGVHGQPIMPLVHLESRCKGAPIVGVVEAPGSGFDVDPAAPHRLVISLGWRHPRFVVGGLDPGRVAKAGLMINAQPHLSASLPFSRRWGPPRRSSW